MEREFTDEMFMSVKDELWWYKPLVRKICNIVKIDTKKFVAEIPDNDAYCELTNMCLMQRDDVEMIFDGVCDEKDEKQFFAMVVNGMCELSHSHVSLHRIRNSVKDAEEDTYFDMRKVYGENFDKLVDILNRFDEKYFNDSYVARNDFDESDEGKLLELADVISDMEKSGIDMSHLPWCLHYADIIYTRKAAKEMWERIKNRLMEYDGIDNVGCFGVYDDPVTVCWTTDEERKQYEEMFRDMREEFR